MDELSVQSFIESVRASDEFANAIKFTEMKPSLHQSRRQFIRSLPPACRILDLGGIHQAATFGALVTLRYPYAFDELVIVDLPPPDKHPIFQQQTHAVQLERVESPLGPVFYHYHSMTDLSAYQDESFDLVYSGQSIEHVTEREADVVLAEVKRVLRPGGYLALDTPNGRACRLQQPEFINPDHKVEYTHGELAFKLEDLGLVIREAKGLNYLGLSLARGVFDQSEAAANSGVYAEIEDCYLLAYVAQRPDS